MYRDYSQYSNPPGNLIQLRLQRQQPAFAASKSQRTMRQQAFIYRLCAGMSFGLSRVEFVQYLFLCPVSEVIDPATIVESVMFGSSYKFRKTANEFNRVVGNSG